MVTDDTLIGNADITLKDVVVHMNNMEQRLSIKIEANTKNIASNTIVIRELDKKLSRRIDSLDKKLSERIDALDEDLTATIKDTVLIRRHVGMSIPDEE